MTYLHRVYKKNPYHDEIGRFASKDKAKEGGGLDGYSKDASLRKDGTIVTSNVEDAVKALHEGKKVELDQPRQVSTLLDRLGEVAKEMIAKGEKAPNFDLCNVSVKGSNLFCADSKGINRIEMPQLKGVPVKGSRAGGVTADKRGEVDVTDQFRAHLETLGYKITNVDEKASYLKASQNELNGGKVAGIAGAIRAGKLDEQRLFVSRDNYIVDGHHRWAAQVGIDAQDNKFGDIVMPVARVDIDIIKMLSLANNFAKDWGIPQTGVGGEVKRKKAACCGECDEITPLLYVRWAT